MAARMKLLGLVAVLAMSAAAAGQSLDSRVGQIIRGNDLRQTTASVMIVDLETGQELASLNADDPMLPASNMKLVTTAAALDILGKDFRFQTRLEIVQPGKLANHVVDPNGGAVPGGGEAATPIEPTLVLIGDGDPALGDPQVLAGSKLTVEDLLAQLVKAVKDAGVTSVGRLVVDDRVFDHQFIHEHWPIDQLQNDYCAQVGGLNFYGNVIDVRPEPTALGKSPRVVLEPLAPFIQTSNRAVTARNDHFEVERPLGGSDLIFRGSIASRKSVAYQVTINDPPLHTAKLLADRLESAGVTVRAVERVGEGELLPPGQTLFTIRTTLFEVLQRCNTHSINLYAEALLKRMGREFTGAPGTWNNGGSAVRDFLRRRLGPTSAVVVVDDGSGLSRENRVTSRVLVKVLQAMYADEQLRMDYIQSLAVVGETGTIKGRLPQLKGRVFAKTGYINGVSAFSGFLLTPGPDGGVERAYAFSLIFNDIPGNVRIGDVKRVQDQIVQLLDETTRATAAVTE